MKIQPIQGASPLQKQSSHNDIHQDRCTGPLQDSVSLSFHARLLQAINDPDAARTASRQRKIERLKQEINEGRYQLNEKVIDMIIERMLARSII